MKVQECHKFCNIIHKVGVALRKVSGITARVKVQGGTLLEEKLEEILMSPGLFLISNVSSRL